MDSQNLIAQLLKLSSSKLVLQKIAIVRPFLNDAERSIADFILTETETAANLTVAELAERTDTSEATVFRFCRAVGYSGFSVVRDELIAAVDALQNAPLDLDEAADSWENRIYQVIHMLLGTYVAVDAKHVQASAEAIAKARHASVCGTGPFSARLTEMFVFGLQRLGIPSSAWTDTRMDLLLGDYLKLADVAIGISHFGRNEDVERFLAQAKDNGAVTIAITNYTESPVGKAGDLVLCTGIIEDSFPKLDLAPRISQILVLQYLLDKVSTFQA